MSLLALVRGSPSTPLDVTKARPGRLRRANKLLRLLWRSEYREGLRYGVAATVEHENVPFSFSFASVIDVGAHVGQFAMFTLRRFPRAILYCVEPLPYATDRLARILASRPQAAILKLAASNSVGTRRLFVSRATDSSSLLSTTERCTTAFPGTETVATIDVPAAPLDQVFGDTALARPTLLKIDVQGGEMEVLQGATDTLKRIDEVFVECSFVELYSAQPLVGTVVAHLHHQGFRLTGVYSMVHDGGGRCLQADLLFRRADATTSLSS